MSELPTLREVDCATRQELLFVTVLDLHLSPVTPVSRKDDFLESTAEVWDQVLRFAVKVNATAILLAGDIFHLKSASRNPPKFLRRAIKMFRSAWDQGVEIWGIAGNHDLTFGSLASFEDQPIGVLEAAGVFQLLDTTECLVKADGFSVKVSGRSFHHSQAAHVRDLKKGNADFLVGLGHFWFGRETGNFFGEPVYGPDFLGTTEVDAYVIGHHHADQGIPVLNGKTYFAHGSINRIGAHAGDMERKPAVGLMRVTKDGITGQIARLKVPPATDIFDVAKREAVEREQRNLDEFLQMISDQVAQEDDIESMVEAMGLTTQVKARVKDYLTKAEEDAA